MASLKDLETALVNADAAGDADAARRLAVAVRDARAKPVESADRIPGMGTAPQPAAAPSIGQQALGAGEAGLAAITAPFAYLHGLARGGDKLVQKILYGATGTPGGDQVQDPGEAFDQGNAALQYVPRTDAGKDMTESLVNGLAPLAGMAGEAGALSEAVRLGRSGSGAATTARGAAEGVARDAGALVSPAAGDAAAAAVATAGDTAAQAARTVQRTATTLPRRAWAAISRDDPAATPTPGTLGSAGAAATDIATQRVATAEQLGLTGDAALTKGQATRDAEQLKFEAETAKSPEMGAKLRERRLAQNEALLNEIERDIDITGAQAPTVRAVGESVDKALVQQYRADKTKVNAAYNVASNSPEANAIVDMAAPVTIGEGDRALTSTPFDYINSKPAGIKSTAVVDAAREYAVKLGIGEMQDGKLVPKQSTIQQLENWRSEIGGAVDRSKAPDLLHGTILKGLIDAQTEPVAGPLFRQARNARTRLAQNYEDRASIAKLLDRKPGTQDRAVALEDVFDHSIMKGSQDDVRNVRRVLQRSGPDGAQAWRELQGQTLKSIRDAATKSVAADASGNRVISPAALDRTVRGLDHDGKLEVIFGKLGAQRLRDINDIAAVAKTVPPEAGVNFSNTAATLLAAFGDVGASALTGIPAPLATATRLGLKHVKDAKTRKRIAEALAGLPRASAKTNP